jgi:hydroxypyruvate reductase
MEKLYQDAHTLIKRSIEANLPSAAVQSALGAHRFGGPVSVLAIGKAAWTMADAAQKELKGAVKRGIVITKYKHSQGAIPGFEIMEAGHPIPDENTIKGTEKAIEMAKGLSDGDEFLFLISGGGSALFEKPLPGLSLADIVDVNNQLLASGADIVEINMIRKRLSSVKAGRFAQICAPAKIFTVVLSDVLGDRLDAIASGPASPDFSTVQDALDVVQKYHLRLNETVKKYLAEETPKRLDNVETVVTGSVRTLCQSAADVARGLGYIPYVLCTEMNCEAKEAGRLIAAIARSIDKEESAFRRPCAVILGGETIVHLTGAGGKGGRNQEIALAAAEGIAGLEKTIVFSVGSDGTDGPTDAAGGIVDGTTADRLKAAGINIASCLHANADYEALNTVNALVLTGPTGTNVNDISVILAG